MLVSNGTKLPFPLHLLPPSLQLRMVPTNTEFFSAVYKYDYAGKADLSKGYWNPKRKLGVTVHFSKIIKQQHF